MHKYLNSIGVWDGRGGGWVWQFESRQYLHELPNRDMRDENEKKGHFENCKLLIYCFPPTSILMIWGDFFVALVYTDLTFSMNPYSIVHWWRKKYDTWQVYKTSNYLQILAFWCFLALSLNIYVLYNKNYVWTEQKISFKLKHKQTQYVEFSSSSFLWFYLNFNTFLIVTSSAPLPVKKKTPKIGK